MAVGGAFPDKKVIARLTAQMLLEIGAIQFNSDKPFIFSSGWASPVYVNCRKLISYPRMRQSITEFGASIILRDVGFECFDAVAGGETAGIPFAAWMADHLMLPMQYVRKHPKGFGPSAQIEGHLEEGQRILLVEDLTTDGRSKANFCRALRKAGTTVDHIFIIFNYGIFPDSAATMTDIGVTLHALATFWDVLDAAKESDYFSKDTLDQVERYLNDPVGWSVAHGGVEALRG
jgi:orotate phosphoribosyltransferase